MNQDNYYTADFINLLLHGYNQEALSIQVYPAITAENIQDYFKRIELSIKHYHIIPLNVAYDEKEPQHKNHWVLLIVDKRHQLMFYLDPAIKQAIPTKVNELKINLGYQSKVILNPINFQQQEKQEGWLRHCGAYLIEIFKVFRQYIQDERYITGGLPHNARIDNNSISLQAALSVIPCGEAEAAVRIRKDHIKDACNILAGDLENLSEIKNTPFESSANLGSYWGHLPKPQRF